MAGDREKPLEVFSVIKMIEPTTGLDVIDFSTGYPAIKRDLYMSNSADFELGTTTGSMIGTASGQKLAFWGRTPVTLPIVSGGGSQATGVFTTTTAMSGTLASLIKALSGCGIISGATGLFA